MEKSSISKVSVLLAAHNGIRWVEEQVDSILKQKNVELRLVVSVDVSDDGTEAWFDDLKCKDSRVELLPHGKHFGRAAANFFRLILESDLGDSEYVALADQDDIWFSDKLDYAISSMRAHNVDAYSANVLAYWPSGVRSLVEKSQPQRRWDYLFEAAGPGCTYVLSRELFEAFRSCIVDNRQVLEDIFLHDWMCYAFARSNNYAWYIDPEPKMLYRQHNDNQMGVHRGWKAIWKRTRGVTSGWWVEQARALARLLSLENEPHVRPWINPSRRAGYIFLFRNVFNFRRKRTDALLMAGAMLIMLLS